MARQAAAHERGTPVDSVAGADSGVHLERHAVEEVLLHALNRVGDELIDLRLVILEMTGEAVGEVVRVGKILVGTWLG